MEDFEGTYCSIASQQPESESLALPDSTYSEDTGLGFNFGLWPDNMSYMSDQNEWVATDAGAIGTDNAPRLPFCEYNTDLAGRFAIPPQSLYGQNPQTLVQDGYNSPLSSLQSHISSSFDWNSNRSEAPTCETPITPLDQTPPESSPSEKVCFGMVTDLKATVITGATPYTSVTWLVRLINSSSFMIGDLSTAEGYMENRESKILDALMEDGDLELEALCRLDETAISARKRADTSLRKLPGLLSIIVYGPESRFDDVGSFFEECRCYLQDPVGCTRDVKYLNPHRLSGEECPMTSSFMSNQSIDQHEEEQYPDLLDMLNTDYDIPEAKQPTAIKTRLLSHQKQALTFMTERESDTPQDSHWDIWKPAYSSRGVAYIDQVTGQRQKTPPDRCQGGIIADPMGLGKSLTIISLIANDLDISEDIRPTVLIVPLVLLGTWKEQIEQHTHQDTLKYYIHHGKDCQNHTAALSGYHIVITTYQRVLSEWKNTNNSMSSLLFSYCWRRVVLDEGHTIRNSSTETTRAVCALNAQSRWAVTGTPLQNSLNDLASLLKFIRAAPYSDERVFNDKIIKLWNSEQREEAITRLKRLLRCVLLRRPQATITLPPRQDDVCPIEFTDDEKSVYSTARSCAAAAVMALNQDGTSPGKASYRTVLQTINDMRMTCNLGVYYQTLQRETHDATYLPKMDQRCFKEEFEANQYHLNAQNDSFGYQGTQGLHPWQSISSEDYSPPALSPSPSPSSRKKSKALRSPCLNVIGQLPSKVEAVVKQVGNQEKGLKTIIFSQWTSTLDVVQLGLTRSGIPCVHCDGRQDHRMREAALHQFKHDESIPVLLMTLASGAVGLNLAIASQVYLMEPAWNPTIEEQAIARVHRMGQKREVRTTRFYVQDSFEEHILAIQKSKRALAQLLLTQPNESTEDSLQLLKSLI